MTQNDDESPIIEEDSLIIGGGNASCIGPECEAVCSKCGATHNITIIHKCFPYNVLEKQLPEGWKLLIYLGSEPLQDIAIISRPKTEMENLEWIDLQKFTRDNK